MDEKNKNPLVSIIVCTYNRAGMLKESMPSILAQDYQPVEIVVVDDGSADNTREVIESFGGPKKIRYFRQENKGIAAARTYACRHLARGEYIAFQDDDDLMMPHRITYLYEALKRYPRAVLATGDWEFIDTRGEPTGQRVTFNIKGDIKGGRLKGPVLIEDGYRAVMWPLLSPLPNGTLFRRTDGESAGWLDPRFSRSSDTDFFARLGQMGPIVYVPEVVAYYRTGHAHMWGDTPENELICAYNSFLLFEKHLSSSRGKKEMRARLRSRMLASLKSLASLSRRCGRTPGSVMEDYVTRGRRLLGIKERLSYAWYANFKLPLRLALKDRH